MESKNLSVVALKQPLSYEIEKKTIWIPPALGNSLFIDGFMSSE